MIGVIDMDSKNIFKRILYYMNPKHIEPKMVKLWAFWIVFWVVLFLVPTKMVTGSFWILVPLAGAVCICSGHKRCYAVAGFRYIFMLHIVV